LAYEKDRLMKAGVSDPGHLKDDLVWAIQSVAAAEDDIVMKTDKPERRRRRGRAPNSESVTCQVVLHSPEMKARILEICELEDRSVSSYIGRLIARDLKRRDEKRAQARGVAVPDGAPELSRRGPGRPSLNPKGGVTRSTTVRLLKSHRDELKRLITDGHAKTKADAIRFLIEASAARIDFRLMGYRRGSTCLSS
jgi:hypothetical protein